MPRDEVVQKLRLNLSVDQQVSRFRTFDDSFDGKILVNTVSQLARPDSNNKKTNKRILRIRDDDHDNDDDNDNDVCASASASAKRHKPKDHISDHQAVAAVGGRTLYRNDGFFKERPCFVEPLAVLGEPGRRLFLRGNDHIFGFAMPPLIKDGPPGIALHDLWFNKPHSDIARTNTDHEVSQAFHLFDHDHHDHDDDDN
jgi:hypothetical protein